MAPLNTSMKLPMGLLVVNSVFIMLAFIAVVLRLWARSLRRMKWRFDDYAIIMSWFMALGLILNLNYGMLYSLVLTLSSACQFSQAITKGGIGQHQETVSYDEGVFLFKMFVVSSALWTVSTAAVKISTLHFYTTIFANQKFIRFAYTIIGFCVAYAITYVVATFLMCRPFAFNWDKPIEGGTCIDHISFFLSASLIGLFLDVIIMVMPMPMLWGLNLPLHKRLALTLMFGMGAFICIITILRAASNQQFDYNDIPYSAAMDALWTGLEPTLSIINACLTILQPLFTTFSTSIKSSFSSRVTSTKEESALTGALVIQIVN
ncbi:hypothetical protein GLAREA_10271 [Glarea lozoyensis ATCC 20868]|uniref:Rhodopsin domain-containing protein n=1 Tax=Glarea lozoyensis (strain ATCC 20868 / MF5171) TaxID=1116229 RepID=S3D7T6_GLAL2|nr:uncharacterized protein GLAREA_10271 [Glarea lozoyensis ATCC 20868]EPE34577.1 hypothetical protein GLAREA_10271 [Glarea lozoyensis ATCC 20868]